MKRFDVCLKLGQLAFKSAEEAAENAFGGCFAEALYQPSTFEVTDVETGEVRQVDLTHLHTENALYGPKEITEKLRCPFEFAISDSFIIPNRGTVLTGKVNSGVVRVGDSVLLKSNGKEVSLSVALIELNRQLINEAYFTEQVGLMFKDVDLSYVVSGDILVGYN